MGLARRSHTAQTLQRLKHPKRPDDATADGRFGLVADILERHDRDLEYAYRNFQWGPTERPQAGAGGGAPRERIRRPPVCSLVTEMDQMSPPMSIVAFPIWNRNPVRELAGVPDDAEIRRITGVVYVEPFAGGEPQAFLADCLPMAQPLYVPAGSLVGYDIGFGRYGDGTSSESERGKFRIDVFVFREEGGAAELTAMVPDGSARFMSTNVVLDSSLLAAYLDAGLRFKCNLTFSG